MDDPIFEKNLAANFTIFTIRVMVSLDPSSQCSTKLLFTEFVEKLSKQKIYLPNPVMDLVWMTQNLHAVIRLCFSILNVLVREVNLFKLSFFVVVNLNLSLSIHKHFSMEECSQKIHLNKPAAWSWPIG